MATFVVEHIPEFDTLQKVGKLLRNGKCLYNEFVAEIQKDKNLENELDELFVHIEDVANNQRVPHTKYRKLHVSSKLTFTPYEAKSSNLRVYLFHDSESGQIIVCGGKKTEQDEDIEKVERIIKEYSAWKLGQKKISKKNKKP